MCASTQSKLILFGSNVDAMAIFRTFVVTVFLNMKHIPDGGVRGEVDLSGLAFDRGEILGWCFAVVCRQFVFDFTATACGTAVVGNVIGGVIVATGGYCVVARTKTV